MTRMLRKYLRPAATMALLAAALAAAATAAGDDQPKEPTGGVYVRDSTIAMEQFALAVKMERAREWKKAADLYQEIIEKYPDRVVALPVSDAKTGAEYQSVAIAVQDQLAGWKPEGLAVYRARYESVAAGMLKQAAGDDLSPLHRVWALYYVTESAKTAGLRMMDAYFERGDYASASWIGDRLLGHPSMQNKSSPDRPMVIYRAALAHKLIGDDAKALELLEEMKRDHGDAVGLVRGVEVRLAEGLNRELASAHAAVAQAAGDSWPTFGGDAARSKISSANGKPGARLYGIPLAQPIWRDVGNPDMRRQLLGAEANLRKSGALLGVMPVVDRGELFFQDNTRLYAISVDGGVPLPGWAATYAGHNGQYSLSGARPLPAGVPLTVTITENDVLAVMGLADFWAVSNGLSSGHDARLVCLDRQTGRERWTVSARSLPDDQSSLRDLQFGSSPLVVGDSVYITARGGKGQGFEDCYVLCFDLASGKPRWASYVAGAATGQMMPTPSGAWLVGGSGADPAYSGGRIFVATNLGAVAALDQHTGAIIWLTVYRDSPPPPVNWGNVDNAGPMVPPPWTRNPAMVQNGKLFVMPPDSDAVLVMDAGGGKIIQRIEERKVCEVGVDPQHPPAVPPAPPNTLLGVLGDRLILGSINQIFCVDWKRYPDDSDPSYLKWATTRLFRTDAHSPPGQSPNDTIAGRAFVTRGAVYVPLRWGLVQLPMSSGLMGPRFPPGGWGDNLGPGNVLVTQDYVIVAGDQHVDVYADLDLARAKFDREVAAAPSDPEPRLRYAEVMFASGQGELAMSKLDEAIGMLGGLSSMRTGAGRDRVFNDALSFAVEAAKSGKGAEFYNKLFDRAEAAALTPGQQVNYRLRRAASALALADLGYATQLYQEILLDEQLRSVPVEDAAPGSTAPAGSVAQKQIAGILRRPLGPAAYEPFEKLAADALAKAQNRGDADQLLAVAQSYPNARVARGALSTAAAVYESEGKNGMAGQVWRQMYFKFPTEDHTQILEGLARNAVRRGRFEAAAAFLARAAAVNGDAMLSRPLILPNNTVLKDVKLQQAQQELAGYSDAAAAPPRLNLPGLADSRAYIAQHGKLPDPFLAEDAGLQIANVATLLTPSPQFMRYDRVATYVAAGVTIYPAAQATPVGTCPQITQTPRGAAWIGGNLLTWTDDGLYLIDGQTAKLKWRLELTGLPPIEVTEPEAAADSGAPAPQGQMVMVNGRGMRLRLLQRRNGWPGVMPGGPAGGAGAAVQAEEPGEHVASVVLNSDRILLATTTGRVMAVDRAGGQIAWQTRHGQTAPHRLLVNDDFAVLLQVDGSTAQIVVLDTDSGELLGRRTFSATTGQSPVNIALAADGTLVYTLADTICFKDLFEIGPDKSLETRNQSIVNTPNPNNPNLPTAAGFLELDQPDQLLAYRGKAFALCDQGQDVRVYALASGQPWIGADRASPGILTCGKNYSGGRAVSLHVAGTYLYVRGDTEFQAYQIDDAAKAHWEKPTEQQPACNLQDAYFAADYVLVRDHPFAAADRARELPYQRLLAFSRGITVHGTENGGWQYTVKLPDDREINACQLIDGGFCYLGGDGIVHRLLGAGNKRPLAPLPP